METLKLGAGLAAVWLLVSCVTVPVEVVRPVPEPSVVPEPEPTVPPVVPEMPRVLASPETAGRLTGFLDPAWSDASSLDLEAWPFGWVSEPLSGAALGWPNRFWTDQKPLWKQALDPSALPPLAVRRLESIHRNGSAEESARAAWLLFRVHSQAALHDQARAWLDKADGIKPTPATALERSWDQLFRLQDPAGARALWPHSAFWPTPDLERKALLVRQKLFAGRRSLQPFGADDFISTQILDRDDLWAATWNGAVVRWSLSTDQVDLVLEPRGTVSPVKLLVATGWFLYAFQDQSLMRYSKVTGTWRSFPYPVGWTGLRVQSAVPDGEEALWVANLGQGLWRWSQGQWTLVDDGGGGPFLNALSADGKGGFLVGTKDRGLWGWKAGLWTPISSGDGEGPVNVSVVEHDGGDQWFVGSWGEGTWVYSQGRLSRWSPEPDYVTTAAWDRGEPVWGALDQGVVQGRGPARLVLGPRSGLPTGGISGLIAWDGRWIWGTTGQGWGWWTEHENPAVLR